MTESESVALPLGDAPVINIEYFTTIHSICQVLFSIFFKFSAQINFIQLFRFYSAFSIDITREMW